jgi:hypothetical protein
MNYAEFQAGIKKLQAKWANVMNPDQVTLGWEKWKDLPDGLFASAVNSVLFKCVNIPSGERISEEIFLALESFKRATSHQQRVLDNGCRACKGLGYKFARTKDDRYECVYICSKCNAKDLNFKLRLPTLSEVTQKGYYPTDPDQISIPKPPPGFSSAAEGLCRVIHKNIALNRQGSNGYEYGKRYLKLSDDEALQLYHEFKTGIAGPIAAKTKNHNSFSQQQTNKADQETF